MASAHRTWIRSTPCPRCTNKGRCSVDPGGRGCYCYHADQGTWGHAGPVGDDGGQTFWLEPPANPNAPEARAERHRRRETTSQAPPSWVKPAHPLATSGQIDKVYRRLLELCPLTAHDYELLAADRGIQAREAKERLRIGRLPNKASHRALLTALEKEFGEEVLLGVPGIVRRPGKKKLSLVAAGTGLLIPVGPAAGRPITSLRLRLDEETDGGRYRLLSGGALGAKATPEAYVVMPDDQKPGIAVVTEGEFKAIACAKHYQAAAVGVPGVGSWSLALAELQEAHAETVLVAWDADHMTKPQVFTPLAALVDRLRADGYTVRLLLWPAEHKGIDDAIPAGVTPRELTDKEIDAHMAGVSKELGLTPAEEAAEESLTDEEHAPRPTVRIRKNDLRAQKLALAKELALLDPPAFFEMGGSLVAVSDHRMSRPSTPALLSDLDELFKFEVLKKKDDVEEYQTIIPPRTLLETLHCRPAHFGVPKLRDFTTAPVILRDGTVTTRPGYYPEHLVYYSGEVACEEVPEEPTPAQLATAVRLLEEPLQDFPFLEQDKANFFALLLALVGRDVIEGMVPPFLFAANTAGTGKGLLAETASRMATGREAFVSPWRSKEDEMAKAITSYLLAGERLVVLDNVNDTMDSGVFAAATTSRTWTDRALGGNSILKLENRAVFLATANNPTMTGEISRRFVTVELATTYENPHERKGFAISNLAQWLEDRQGDILAALLTLWRAWFSAGKPRWYDRKVGSFEEFSEVVGGVLAIAGIDGFLANRDRVREDVDTETAAWRVFVGEWFRVYQDRPVTSSQLHVLCCYEDPEADTGFLRGERAEKLLSHVLGAGNEDSQRMRLGRALGKARNRTFGLHQIQSAKMLNGYNRFNLHPVTPDKDIFFPNSSPSPLSPLSPLNENKPSNHADLNQVDFKWTSETSPLSPLDPPASGQETSGLVDLVEDVHLQSPLKKNGLTKPFETDQVDLVDLVDFIGANRAPESFAENKKSDSPPSLARPSPESDKLTPLDDLEDIPL